MAYNKYYEKHSEIVDDTILVQPNVKKSSITPLQNNNNKKATNIILAPIIEM